MTYVYLTDKSTAITGTMNTLHATVVYSGWPNHTLWLLAGANPFDGKTGLDATGLFATVLLPVPL